jgi:hemolysin III
MSSVVLSDLSVGGQVSFDAALADLASAARPAKARPSSVYHPVAGTTYDGPLVDRAAEEWSNWLTHGLGAILSVGGAYVLMGRLGDGHHWSIVLACAVYLVTLVGVYASSTLSHYVEHAEWKYWFRALDQAFIYMLIVGNYTPVAVMYLYGGGLSILFWAMWGVALVGFLSKTLLKHRVDAISTGTYLTLAWLPAISIPTAWGVLPTSALLLIFAGGFCYMLGMVFFVRDHRVRYAHAAWHVLVMAGSACHFYAISDCVAAVGKVA